MRIHVVMASLMDRLSRFAAQDGAAVAAQFDAVDAFGKLKRAALRVRSQGTTRAMSTKSRHVHRRSGTSAEAMPIMMPMHRVLGIPAT